MILYIKTEENQVLEFQKKNQNNIDNIENKCTFALQNFSLAGVMKLVDMLDLGSSAARLGGSSPFTRTKIKELSA